MLKEPLTRKIKFFIQKNGGGTRSRPRIKLVKHTSEGGKGDPSIYCKPLLPNPGGDAFYPFPTQFGTKGLQKKLWNGSDTMTEQINNNARAGLTRIGAGDMTLSQLAKESVKLGLVKRGCLKIPPLKIQINLKWTRDYG